jgi:Protein of unknown function (DUF2924)
VSRNAETIALQLDKLERMSPAELKAEWERVTCKPSPRLSRKLLRLAVGYELQARYHGALPRQTGKELARLAASAGPTRTVCAGTRLVREWAGKLHVVTIGEDKVIRWNEREWGSLSEVARAITGTRWSGPAFFGLKQKERAA